MNLADLPEHMRPTEDGPTGSPIVEVLSIKVDNHVQQVRTMPPLPPTRTITDYDVSEDHEGAYWCELCDTWHADSELTDEEFAEAQERYKRADAEWNRTRGVYMVPGHQTTDGSFKCEDGAIIEGIMKPSGGWIWTRWDMPTQHRQRTIDRLRRVVRR